MKRYGNLYPQIVDFENLLTAAKKAEKGKRFKDNVLDFNYNREGELVEIQKKLIEKTYQPGKYRTFYIKEPKSRLISAAPYNCTFAYFGRVRGINVPRFFPYVQTC